MEFSVEYSITKFSIATALLSLMRIKQQNTDLKKIHLFLIYTVNTMQIYFTLYYISVPEYYQPYFICNFVLSYLSMLVICVFILILLAVHLS